MKKNWDVEKSGSSSDFISKRTIMSAERFIERMKGDLETEYKKIDAY